MPKFARNVYWTNFLFLSFARTYVIALLLIVWIVADKVLGPEEKVDYQWVNDAATPQLFIDGVPNFSPEAVRKRMYRKQQGKTIKPTPVSTHREELPYILGGFLFFVIGSSFLAVRYEK